MVGVTTTSEPLASWLLDNVGGSVARQRRACEEGCELMDGHIHRRQTILRWHVSGERACIILRSMLPYLVIKQGKAVEVLDRYEQALATMLRPKRRLHHVVKERMAMTAIGWD